VGARACDLDPTVHCTAHTSDVTTHTHQSPQRSHHESHRLPHPHLSSRRTRGSPQGHTQSKESRPPTRPPTCAPPPPSEAGPCADTPSDCMCDERYLTATHIADTPQQRDSRARPWRQERQDDVCVRCDTEGTWSRRWPPAVRSHATKIDLLRRREKKNACKNKQKKVLKTIEATLRVWQASEGEHSHRRR